MITTVVIAFKFHSINTYKISKDPASYFYEIDSR